MGRFLSYHTEIERIGKDCTRLQNLYYDILELIDKYTFDLLFHYIGELECRTYAKNHLIDTGLPPSQFYETDYLLMHGMFQLFCDFVEYQCADQMRNCDRYNESWFCKNDRHIRIFLRQILPYRWTHARSRYYGEKYLELKANYIDEQFPDCDNQKSWNEWGENCLKLYRWWKDERPNRPEPYTLFTDISNQSERVQRRYELEQSYEQEDEDMMKLLIEMRGGLWT